ncbi:hypothetical protein LINGRAPRIM_LOCUS481, partial [Linum grandiflorum]
ASLAVLGSLSGLTVQQRKVREVNSHVCVCVEVDLSKRLLPKYKPEGVTYLVAYEVFHKICTNCGMYGAPTHLCQCRVPHETDPMVPEPVEPQKVRDPSNGQVFGDWMMPKRKAWHRTKPSPQPDGQYSSINKQRNRFDVLISEDDDATNEVSASEENCDDRIGQTNRWSS